MKVQLPTLAPTAANPNSRGPRLPCPQLKLKAKAPSYNASEKQSFGCSVLGFPSNTKRSHVSIGSVVKPGKVKVMDGFIWSDHKPVWFQHLEQSGKSPEELRELFCIQLDSYNLMTLLLLSSVVPTATGICADIGWDEDGWPVDKLKFFCLIFSFIYSGLLILHFCMSHILHLLVSGVSPANYPVFMRACGCDFLSEIGVAYVVILYLFAPWMFSCMAVLLGRSANWIIWASSFGVVLLSWIFQASFTFPLLGRHDDGSRPRVADTAYNSSRLLLRLVLHSGLLHQDRAPLDPSLPRDALLEQMAELSLEEIEHRARASDDRICLHFSHIQTLHQSFFSFCTADRQSHEESQQLMSLPSICTLSPE